MTNNVSANPAWRLPFINGHNSTTPHAASNSQNKVNAQADQVKISDEAKQYNSAPVNLADILGVSEAELSAMQAERAGRLSSGLGLLTVSESQLRTLEYSFQMARAMFREPYTGLEEQMSNLANSFEEIQKSVDDNSDDYESVKEDAFRNIAIGMFIRDAEFQFRSSTNLTLHTDTSEGRMLNQDYLDLNDKVRTEAKQRASLFADEFFSNVGIHGAEKAFEIAWAMVNKHAIE